MRVPSLGWEDPLEKEVATLSSTLAWEIPWTEEPGGQQSTGSQGQTRQCAHMHAGVCLQVLSEEQRQLHVGRAGASGCFQAGVVRDSVREESLRVLVDLLLTGWW